MSSAIEQMTRNANWGALAKATELKQRILFVLGALLVYRFGTFIPVPGIDPEAWGRFSTRAAAVSWTCSTCSRAAPCSG